MRVVVENVHLIWSLDFDDRHITNSDGDLTKHNQLIDTSVVEKVIIEPDAQTKVTTYIHH